MSHFMYVLICKYVCICIYAYVCIYVCGGGLLIKLCPTLAIPWTVACQAPLSMEFSRQEYWNGLAFPSLGDLPNTGIKPVSPALQADDFPHILYIYIHTHTYGLLQWLSGEKSAWSAGAKRDAGLIPGLGRFPGGGHSNPLKYSCLENPVDRGPLQTTIHSVTNSQTQLK